MLEEAQRTQQWWLDAVKAGRIERYEIEGIAGGAACGCPECNDSVQPGHFACSPSPDWALELEAAGKIARHYDESRWVWEAV